MKRLGRNLSPPIHFGRKSTSARVDDPAYYLERITKLAGVSAEPEQNEITYLPRSMLRPNPSQPRRHFDQGALEDLAESIRAARGILQPLIVRPCGANCYEIIAGERRWRAAELADVDELPCIVRAGLDERQVLMLSLIENIQRSDLNPIEEAHGLRRLIDEFGLSHLEAANAVGRSRSSVTNLLRLLDLAECVQDALAGGLIDMGHARALAGVDHDGQTLLLRDLVAGGWSVRRTEQAVRAWHAKAGEKQTSQCPYTRSELSSIERQLEAKLGYGIKVRASSTGKVSITLDTLSDLSLLIAMENRNTE